MSEPQADLPPPPSPSEATLDRALALVEFLRGNCPWDAAQTSRSLRRYLVEETHEVIDAIDAGDASALRDELGDLLLNLAFQIVIAEERGQFTRDEIVRGLEEKMERRHPQLYGRGDAEPWESSKARERDDVTAPDDLRTGGVLSDLSPAADALRHAHRIQERVATVGFDWPDAEGAWRKVTEEVEEVRVELAARDEGAFEEELGDLLFSIVNLARLSGVDAPMALSRANTKFIRRFAVVETLAQRKGLVLGEAGLDALDELWERAKRGET